MLCSACSRSFDSSARYCTGCGQPLVGQVEPVKRLLMRARYGRMIAGVCSGFANTYGFDVTVTRLVLCALALFSGGTILLAYLIAWIVMPQAPYVLPESAVGATAS